MCTGGDGSQAINVSPLVDDDDDDGGGYRCLRFSRARVRIWSRTGGMYEKNRLGCARTPSLARGAFTYLAGGSSCKVLSKESRVVCDIFRRNCQKSLEAIQEKRQSSLDLEFKLKQLMCF